MEVERTAYRRRSDRINSWSEGVRYGDQRGTWCHSRGWRKLTVGTSDGKAIEVEKLEEIKTRNGSMADNVSGCIPCGQSWIGSSVERQEWLPIKL